MEKYDIIGNSKNRLEARLSNFTARSFTFRGVECASLEGILQSLKCPDKDTQKEMCMFVGKEAKAAGSAYWWQDTQILYWGNVLHTRYSQEYTTLITEIFDAAYAGDESYAEDLFDTGHYALSHSIGLHNMRETILTETEFMFQLYRLRSRVRHDEELVMNQAIADSF